jgi:hypothetical protein
MPHFWEEESTTLASSDSDAHSVALAGVSHTSQMSNCRPAEGLKSFYSKKRARRVFCLFDSEIYVWIAVKILILEFQKLCNCTNSTC